jgi:hypothetical protein
MRAKDRIAPKSIGNSIAAANIRGIANDGVAAGTIGNLIARLHTLGSRRSRSGRPGRGAEISLAPAESVNL